MGTDDHKVYTYHEVSLHNEAKDCWIIVNAKAYNVTSFLDDHPGGGDVLLEAAGNDASEEFEAAGHGSAARLMLDEYYVGEIDPSSAKPTSMANNTTPPAHTFIPSPEVADENVSNGGTSSVSTIIKLLPFLMPLLILGLAAIFRFFSTSPTAKSLD